MAIDVGEAAKIGAIGVAIGALGYYLISKSNINLGGLMGPPPMAPTPMAPPQTGSMQVPTQMPGATTMYASYPAFGYDINGDDQWNNSEVWDTRNRKYFSDNILFNKLPYIPLTTEQDFDPQNLPFSQAYDHNLDQDSPRPRFGTHALDREIADEFYPRRTPLPFYF
jgi:hypothetical protein